MRPKRREADSERTRAGCIHSNGRFGDEAAELRLFHPFQIIKAVSAQANISIPTTYISIPILHMTFATKWGEEENRTVRTI